MIFSCRWKPGIPGEVIKFYEFGEKRKERKDVEISRDKL